MTKASGFGDFLMNECFFCKSKFKTENNIYMYSSHSFCKEECRAIQMAVDNELMKRQLDVSDKKETVNDEDEKLEDTVLLNNETRTEFTTLREIRVTIFKERFEKKLILIYPANLLESSLDIITPPNLQMGNCTAIMMNPRKLQKVHHDDDYDDNELLRPMNLVVWNCLGAQKVEFRRSFRSLLDCYRPCLVVILETKMNDHQVILDEFPFTNMLQVPMERNSGGILILWDKQFLEVDQIAVTGQEVHAMVKKAIAPLGGPIESA